MEQKYIKYKKALNKAMFLCSKSEKCKFDIQKKLYDWKANPFEHEKIIEYLEKNKYIDEERYVKFYVNDKFKYNKWGKIKIKTMLFQKKIPEKLINGALNKINNENYLEMLKNVISKKEKSLQETNPYKLKAKLLQFASSRGFEPDIIMKIIEN